MKSLTFYAVLLDFIGVFCLFFFAVFWSSNALRINETKKVEEEDERKNYHTDGHTEFFEALYLFRQ